MSPSPGEKPQTSKGAKTALPAFFPFIWALLDRPDLDAEAEVLKAAPLKSPAKGARLCDVTARNAFWLAGYGDKRTERRRAESERPLAALGSEQASSWAA